MRVLIVSALFAVAAAAPSGLFAPPAIVPLLRTVVVPEAIPTISPGDIQAAAIDAQVKAQDAAQAAADKARELAEQANESINEKAITEASVATETNLDAFWSSEDKKWQAVDALKTAEAQIDGAVASNAPLLAKSAVQGSLSYIPGLPVAPVVAPIPPVIYSPYVASYSSVATQTATSQEGQTETKAENNDAAVKTAEPAKAEEGVKIESAENANAESAKATESPALKAVENLNAKPAVVQNVISAPIGLYRYDVAVPAFGHVVGQPILKYATAVQHGVLTPTFVKTVW